MWGRERASTSNLKCYVANLVFRNAYPFSSTQALDKLNYFHFRWLPQRTFLSFSAFRKSVKGLLELTPS
jgi:hypothetical protein